MGGALPLTCYTAPSRRNFKLHFRVTDWCCPCLTGMYNPWAGLVRKMNNQEFNGLAAGTARAALLVVGVLGLAVGAVASIQAQEATGGMNSPSGQSVTANLDYRELNYSIISWGLQVTPRSSAFKKEPAFSGGKVIRGMLPLGSGTSDEMGFAWDRTAGKL